MNHQQNHQARLEYLQDQSNSALIALCEAHGIECSPYIRDRVIAILASADSVPVEIPKPPPPPVNPHFVIGPPADFLGQPPSYTKRETVIYRPERTPEPPPESPPDTQSALELLPDADLHRLAESRALKNHSADDRVRLIGRLVSAGVTGLTG